MDHGFHTIRMIVGKNDVVTVFEENEKNRHRLGTILFSDNELPHFHRRLVDLFVDSSLCAMGLSQEQVIKLAKQIKYVWEFEQ